MNSTNLANAPSPTRFKHIPDSHKVLIVFIDTRHGTGGPEKVVPWLLISDEQHEQLGGLSMDTLAQWCRATTGQAGVLRLDWQNSGTESFTFKMRPCGFCAPAIPPICRLTRIPALLGTVIPSVEYTSTGRSEAVRGSRNIQSRSSEHRQSSTDGDSSRYTTATANLDECPDGLVSSFHQAGGPAPKWRRLAADFRTTLRKRLLERDNGQCVFTGDAERAEVAHFVKKTHPFWVSFLLSSHRSRITVCRTSSTSLAPEPISARFHRPPYRR
jgi:hypothetical protein